MKTKITYGITKLVSFFFIFSYLFIFIVSCQKAGIDELAVQPTQITKYTLPRAVVQGIWVQITGIGIVTKDTSSLYLRPEMMKDTSQDIHIDSTLITNWSVAFLVPPTMAEGKYLLVLKLDNQEIIVERTVVPVVPLFDNFSREPIDGNAMIVGEAKLVLDNIPAFAVGDEVVFKGIGFDASDRILVNSALSIVPITVIPSLVDNTQLRFIIPTNAKSGGVSLLKQNTYSKIVGQLIISDPIKTVSNVKMPTSPVASGGTVNITGTGFISGDGIVLKSSTTSGKVIANLNASNLSFVLSPNFSGQKIQVLLSRGNNPLLSLGFLSTSGGAIVDCSIPAKIPSGLTPKTLTISINGTGFLPDDKIQVGTGTPIPVKSWTTNNITLDITTQTPVGNTTLTLVRGNESQLLGSLAVVNGPRIGDYDQGGVVFYLNPDDMTKGMVCDVKDATPYNLTTNLLTWGAYRDAKNVIIPVPTRDIAIGKGQSNTTKIIKQYETAAQAAKYCDDLIVNVNGIEYNDWFLPSIEELKQLFIQRNVVATTAKAKAGTDFNRTKATTVKIGTMTYNLDGYASSTAYDASRVYVVNFYSATLTDNTFSILYTKVDHLYRVRAVRNF